METNKKIKVCHLTSVHGRHDGRVFGKECLSLAKAGYDVTLVVNDLVEDEENGNVKIISTKYKPKNRIERFIRGKNEIFAKAKKIDADLYHFHDPELLQIGLKLKKMGKKVIFDSHEMYAHQIMDKNYIPKMFRKIVSKVYWLYESYVCKRIDAVINPATVDGQNYFEKRAKITEHIDNVPKLKEYYEKFNSSMVHNSNYVCYTGGLTKSRGITNLIKSCYMANIKLILAGKYDSNMYEEEVKELKEYSCVEYKGFVGSDKIAEIYNDSFAGMCTILNVGQYNKGDNLPTKVYEYMGMGLPVILTDSKYNRKINDECNFAILVNPDNVIEISDAIKYLYENKEIAKQMGENGRRAILERFNWEIEEKKLIELYRILCG